MLSFVVTAFDEMTPRRDYGQKLMRCIRPAQEHESISEIIVVDDGSKDFAALALLLDNQLKVSLYRNTTNRGVFGNKLEAVACAHHEWVVTCDSDNVMEQEYLDRVAMMPKDRHLWYCACFARPRFDCRDLAGVYNLLSIHRILNKPIFPCFFNTGNQVVNRLAFLDVFEKYRDGRADLVMPNYLNLAEEERKKHYWRMVFDACDSFIFNMEWVFAGNFVYVVERLEYDHTYTTGDDGNYSRSPAEKAQLGEVLMKKLRAAADQGQIK